MKRHGLLISAILAGALGTASSAAADTTDALLGKLLAKGILTQAEYDELMRRKAVDAPVASASARAPNADASSASANPTGGRTASYAPSIAASASRPAPSP